MRETENRLPRSETTFVFPQRLSARLDGISAFPVTIVEAPSGFGKTTAVREFLKSLQHNSRQSWYTCFGEHPSKVWEGVCRLFGNVDIDVARRLKELFPPTVETLPDIAELMRECRCDAATFLVIDNYQLFESPIPYHIAHAFSAHSNPNLHMLFITQPLPTFEIAVQDANIHRLGTRDFFFDRENTARLCRTAGARMTEKEIDRIQSVSEGWVSAILLQASNYMETGAFADARDMDALVETAIWNRMTGEEHEFLLGLSLLDAFSPRQAAIMAGGPTLPEHLLKMLKNGFFISYIADKGVYSLHSILNDYLKQRFENQPREFAEIMIRRAGAACAAASDYFPAAQFFSRVRDYGAILSMPLTTSYLNEQKEKDIVGFLERFVGECPEQTLQEYPFALLTFAFQFMKSGKRALFSQMVRLLRAIADAPSGLPESTVSRIRGETALLLSFTEFNDIAKMSAYHREALLHLNMSEDADPPKTVVFGSTPWTFGVASVLCLYWSKSGELDTELALMGECMPWYVKLSAGHGAGADSVMRAEACLYRGEETEAEAASHKALYQARSARQTSISLCAELVLARLAVLRGDGEAYATARKSLCGYRKESPERSVVRMVELCLASLDLLLGRTEGIPDWLRDVESIKKTLYIQGHACGLILYGKLLLLEKRFPELYGLTEPAMEFAYGMNYELPRLCQHICLAAAYTEEGREDEAENHLSRALRIALPDRIYLPFAELGTTLLPLLENAKAGFNMKQMNSLIALCKRHSSGAASVRRHLDPSTALLTPREREIALLAKERCSTREIASRLFISENTVKSALKIIYGKLEVHSKNELATMDF